MRILGKNNWYMFFDNDDDGGDGKKASIELDHFQKSYKSCSLHWMHNEWWWCFNIKRL